MNKTVMEYFHWNCSVYMTFQGNWHEQIERSMDSILNTHTEFSSVQAK